MAFQLPSQEPVHTLFTRLNQKIKAQVEINIAATKKIRTMHAQQELAVYSYLNILNASVAHLDVHVKYDIIPGHDDETPDGVPPMQYFHVIHEGEVFQTRLCSKYATPTKRLDELRQLLDFIHPFVDKKQLVYELESSLTAKPAIGSTKI